MINIAVTENFGDVSDSVRDMFRKQIPYSAFLALNSTMYLATQDVRKAMPYFIEGGPVGFTKRGFQYEKAKSKRNMRARMFIPDAQWKYMRWQVDGGDQKWRRSVVGGFNPVKGRIKRNKYGNIPGFKRKISLWKESAMRGGGGWGSTPGPLKGALGKTVFVKQMTMKSGKSILGVWKRRGKRNLELIGSFDHDPIRYNRPKVPFHKYGRRFILKRFSRQFSKKFNQVMQQQAKRMARNAS